VSARGDTGFTWEILARSRSIKNVISDINVKFMYPTLRRAARVYLARPYDLCALFGRFGLRLYIYIYVLFFNTDKHTIYNTLRIFWYLFVKFVYFFIFITRVLYTSTTRFV